MTVPGDNDRSRETMTEPGIDDRAKRRRQSLGTEQGDNDRAAGQWQSRGSTTGHGNNDRAQEQ